MVNHANHTIPCQMIAAFMRVTFDINTLAAVVSPERARSLR
jgi:hypothetical protein